MNTSRSFTGTEARQLLRRARTGTLSTLNRDDGTPYASLVNVATDVTGWPLILVSTLAWHTKNLAADPRASLMVAEMPAAGHALTGARTHSRTHTLTGTHSRTHALTGTHPGAHALTGTHPRPGLGHRRHTEEGCHQCTSDNHQTGFHEFLLVG